MFIFYLLSCIMNVYSALNHYDFYLTNKCKHLYCRLFYGYCAWIYSTPHFYYRHVFNLFQIITTFSMDDTTSDPDFIPPLVTLKDLQLDESFESSESSRSDRSRSLTPFLRSTCHQHKGNTLKIFFM